MKIIVIIILMLLGIYWLVDHTSPMPFNHESFGLFEHNIHRLIGVVFFITAVVVGLKWKPKGN